MPARAPLWSSRRPPARVGDAYDRKQCAVLKSALTEVLPQAARLWFPAPNCRQDSIDDFWWSGMNSSASASSKLSIAKAGLARQRAASLLLARQLQGSVVG
jgi:hypothetical protein